MPFRFAINQLSGALTLQEATVDYETDKQYLLEVTAGNNPEGNTVYPSATTTVTVNVIDKNDNVPTFSTTPITITVAENDIGRQVANPTVGRLKFL